MAGGASLRSNPANARKRVEASTESGSEASLLRAKDGSAFTRWYFLFLILLLFFFSLIFLLVVYKYHLGLCYLKLTCLLQKTLLEIKMMLLIDVTVKGQHCFIHLSFVCFWISICIYIFPSDEVRSVTRMSQ